MEKTKKERGITLIALVITIIILLILAGISIEMLAGDNGIINQAGNAKEQTEIANEKEVIDSASIQAMGKNKRGSLVEEEFQEAMDNNVGDNKTEVNDMGDEFEVFFKDSNRYYMVDKNGNILDYEVAIKDPYPGDITKDENGNTLEGSADSPYQINCIEDLVAFSNMVNNTGKMFKDGKVVDVDKAYSMEGKYIVLTKDLNFKSRASYIDSQRTDFGDINGISNDENTLINELTTGTGFNPIGNNTNNVYKNFEGIFDGNNHKIKNLYENQQNRAGLFGSVKNSTIKNLEIVSGKISASDLAGGIVGYTEDTNIYNCKNNASISGNMAGGIAGRTSNIIIENCGNTASIKGEKAGGIVGYEYATNVKITNSYNLGDIKGLKCAGGIFGGTTAGSLTIYNSYNKGDITSTYNDTTASGGAGGILGFKYHTTTTQIINCVNMGKVYNNTYRGGIIGFNWVPSKTPEVINCFYQKDNGIKGEANNNNSQAIEFDVNTEEVIQKLNNYILETTEEIDTSKWKKWELGEDSYPILLQSSK